MSRSAWWWLPHRRWRVVGTVREADEVPEELPGNGIVQVRSSRAHLKWFVFDCPCGAERVMINADTRRSPAWRLGSGLVRGATIHPSIDTHHDGQRCHYLIRNGQTVWVPGRVGGAR